MTINDHHTDKYMAQRDFNIFLSRRRKKRVVYVYMYVRLVDCVKTRDDRLFLSTTCCVYFVIFNDDNGSLFFVPKWLAYLLEMKNTLLDKNVSIIEQEGSYD